MLRYTTAGESHGPGLTVILEGIPAGLTLSRSRIDAELSRRQKGYGRGGRMTIERDRARIVGGVRFSRTIGGPIAIWIPNLDHENWLEAMSVWGTAPRGVAARRVTRPRPGHADLAGALKYDTHDARDVLERASARETAARVAAGGLAKVLLGELGVETLIDHLQGGKVEKRIDTGVALITPANLDAPESQTLLHPPLEQYLK